MIGLSVGIIYNDLKFCVDYVLCCRTQIKGLTEVIRSLSNIDKRLTISRPANERHGYSNRKSYVIYRNLKLKDFWTGGHKQLRTLVRCKTGNISKKRWKRSYYRPLVGNDIRPIE